MSLPLLLALSTMPSPAPAQRAERDEPERDRSVYAIHWNVDAPIIAFSALGSIVPYALESRIIHPRCPCDPNEVNGFDRPVIGNSSGAAATLSDLTLFAALLAPPVIDYLDLRDDKAALVEDLAVYAEVISVTGAFNTLAKDTVQRPIPLAYSGDPSVIHSASGYVSFYSGHATLAFAALSASAMTLHYRYSTGAWPWLLTAAVGTSVSVERVLAGRHFYTDVMMGAATGLVVGSVVPWLHERAKIGAGRVSFMPLYDGGGLAWSRGI